MDNNPYIDYYKNQAGSGMTVYEGLQYQRGHGFFGSLFSNIIKPLGKWLLPKALSTGVRVGNDLLKGEKMKDSLKRNLKITGEEMLDDGLERAKKFVQTGKGRRRNAKRKASIKKKRKAKPKSVRKKKRKSKRQNFKTKFDSLFK